MKFHTDENVADAVARGLKRRGIDVTTTPEVNLLSATDEEQLTFCLRERRVIVSRDNDMLRRPRVGWLTQELRTVIRKNTRSVGFC